MKSIAITGVTGLLGHHLAIDAFRKGWKIIGLSRRAGTRLLPDCETMTVSTHAVGHSDVVVHLSGESISKPWTRAQRQRILQSRIESTQRLLSAIEKLPEIARPHTLIAASGCSIYGNRGDDLLTESSQVGNSEEGFLTDVALKWEECVREAQELGLRVCHLRSGMILSPYRGAFPMMKRVFNLGLGGKLGSGNQWMPWIHVHDAARAILWIAENPSIAGPVNLCTPETITNRDFTALLAQELNRPAFVSPPTWLLKHFTLGMHELFLQSQRMQPDVLLKSGFAWQSPTLSQAFKRLLKTSQA